VAHEFDRDLPIEAGIMSQMDHAGSAAADPLLQDVPSHLRQRSTLAEQVRAHAFVNTASLEGIDPSHQICDRAP
jgi:hypothetical protein